MQQLPTGEQFFTNIRQDNMVYVDKTRHIYDLMRVNRFVFLSRPRRFGKSLLTTTIREICRGNRALFQGLWIEDKIDWQPSPVLLINFNDVSYRTHSLAQGLCNYLDDLAGEFDISLHADDHKRKFQQLLQQLAKQGKVTLLIDEYDKAITDLLDDAEKVKENVEALKDFYSVLKSAGSEMIKFCFITGISKYGKVAVFSDLNNLTDITMDARFATLTGYTQAELETYFPDYIERLAQKFEVSREEMLAQIAAWYDGYSWDGMNRVYVPYSTLLFLQQQEFTNHWFDTATPSFLIKLLRQNQIPAYDLEQLTADSTLIERADVNNISVLSLLVQTGYLTVKAVHRSQDGNTYDLGYPNREVTQAFQKHLLVDYLGTNPDLSALLLREFKGYLSIQNIEGFITRFKAVFADIPSKLFLKQEAYYHSLVYLTLCLLGFQVHAERMTNLGRIDAVLELPDVVYILEFKLSSGQIALDQIRNTNYAQPYLGSHKRVILLGIAFDKKKRNISDWKHEVIREPSLT